MASWYGNSVHIQIFGQSHAPAVGVVIDGLPAGEPVDLDQLAAFMGRRAPGHAAWSTTRSEADVPEVLSGLNPEGRTCGSPLTIIVRNTNIHPADYDELRRKPRPGHADLTAEARWHGEQDVAGGGHFSGRLTAALAAAGGICLQILERRGVTVGAHIASVAGIADTPYDAAALTPEQLTAAGSKAFPTLDDEAGRAMQDAIEAAREAGDSVGGIVECAAAGMPAGVGSPMFDGLENRLARVIFGIPAVKGMEFGSGFAAADMRGSQHNDPYELASDGHVQTATNHAGGILGGISTGMPILVRAAFKPTPSIALPQRSIDIASAAEEELTVSGRHDPCIVPRAVPVVEAACALALADALADDGLLGPINDSGRDPDELRRLHKLFPRDAWDL